MLLEHTREGMFSDPIYGGNVNFAGWDLIGYPGIKLHLDRGRPGGGRRPRRPSTFRWLSTGGAAHEQSTCQKSMSLIIGIGAAGGIASYVLTQAGIDVVALEAGPRRDKAEFLQVLRRAAGISLHNPFADVKDNKEIPTWRPDAGTPVQAPPVGADRDGRTRSAAPRSTGPASPGAIATDDFKIRSTTVDKYGEEALPAGSNIVDWPMTYDDLEPYYEQGRIPDRHLRRGRRQSLRIAPQERLSAPAAAAERVRRPGARRL